MTEPLEIIFLRQVDTSTATFRNPAVTPTTTRLLSTNRDSLTGNRLTQSTLASFPRLTDTHSHDSQWSQLTPSFIALASIDSIFIHHYKLAMQTQLQIAPTSIDPIFIYHYGLATQLTSIKLVVWCKSNYLMKCFGTRLDQPLQTCDTDL
jgi:hypothetical protein